MPAMAVMRKTLPALLWEVLRTERGRYEDRLQCDEVLAALRVVEAQQSRYELLRVVQRDQAFVVEDVAGHLERYFFGLARGDCRVRIDGELTDEVAGPRLLLVVLAAVYERRHRDDVLLERDRTRRDVLDFGIDQERVGTVVIGRACAADLGEMRPRGEWFRRKPIRLLRQPYGIFRRHVNPSADQHEDRRAREDGHPHLVPRRDETDIGRVVIHGNLRGHREARNRPLGNRPIEHPDDADNEAGK